MCLEFSNVVTKELFERGNFEEFEKKKTQTLTQLKFTCSKSTIEALEKGARYVNYQFWTYFTPSFSVSTVDFKQVNVSWEDYAP